MCPISTSQKSGGDEGVSGEGDYRWLPVPTASCGTMDDQPGDISPSVGSKETSLISPPNYSLSSGRCRSCTSTPVPAEHHGDPRWRHSNVSRGGRRGHPLQTCPGGRNHRLRCEKCVSAGSGASGAELIAKSKDGVSSKGIDARVSG